MPERQQGDFSFAFAKLEEAVEQLVGQDDIKERLSGATITMAPIFPDDFPAGRLRDEYTSIREALTWLPPEEGSDQGLLGATIDAMTEEEAARLARRLFTLYSDAAEVRHSR